jgi:hypothetical protein
MVLFQPEWMSSKIEVADRRNPSNFPFAVWVTVALIALAVLSIVSGAPTVDPAIFASP